MKGSIKVMTRVKKAIIPAAGLGTRFLPATKSIPKEMLPIVDKPTIQYIIEEAVASGIEDIIIITNKNKKAIEDHFDTAKELEAFLEDKNKHSLLKKVEKTSNLCNIYYVRQKEAKGLGDAILCAKSIIGDEPFGVLLGDDIVQNNEGDPGLLQLIEKFNEKQKSIIGVKKVPFKETNRYGIINPSMKEDNGLYQVKNFVEKPELGTAPSDLAIMGRYVLTADIFEYLETQTPGAGGEIQLTDAIEKLNKKQDVYAMEFDGNRYDVGEIAGFVKTTIQFAIENPTIQQEIKEFIKKLNI